mgnify:CR=1 FL=1
MKKLLASVLGLTAFATISQEIQWPALLTTGFVSGRVANTKDIEAGNAAFVAETGGRSIGEPIDILIPQYGFYIENDSKVPVIIIQAESIQGQRIVGARKFDGSEIVATLEEFHLLGRDTPNKDAL